MSFSKVKPMTFSFQHFLTVKYLLEKNLFIIINIFVIILDYEHRIQLSMILELFKRLKSSRLCNWLGVYVKQVAYSNLYRQTILLC